MDFQRKPRCVMRLLVACHLAAVITAVGPGRARAEPPSGESRDGVSATDSPTGYVVAALQLMKRHSLYREETDWPAVERRALESVADAKSVADVYPAIREALVDIGDHHGFLSVPKPPAEPPPDEAAGPADKEEPNETTRPERPQPEVALLPGRVGAVKLFPHSGSDFDWDRRYVADLHERIGQVATQEPVGWIIDLRHNGGGNMWPMLYGVGPILGEGVAGYFVHPDGARKSWAYRTQPFMALIDPQVGLLPAHPSNLGEELPRVAVLIGEGTGSSGEAMAVSFRGRPRSRSFGAPTFGFSTSTTPYRLPDGARLVLTTAKFADRDGNVYGGKIEPDEPVDGDDAVVLAAAKAWLIESAGKPPRK